MGEGVPPWSHRAVWGEGSWKQPGTAGHRGGGHLEEKGEVQAVSLPSVGSSVLLMTQILEVLQAGKLINYFPGVSLAEDRNDAWWA